MKIPYLLPAHLRGPFLPTLLRVRFVVVFILLLLAGNSIGNNFLFEPPARWYTDFLLRTRDRKEAQVTRIVRIEQDDREKVLGGSTPVNGTALVNGICALARSKPAVIVVDMDTSDEKSFPEKFQLPKFGVPVVWAVDADWEPGKQGLSLQPRKLLGGRLADWPAYGIARMPVGFDGLLRGEQSHFHIGTGEAPSLATAAVEEYCKEHPPCEHGHAGHETTFGREYFFTPMTLAEFAPPFIAATTVPAACPVGGDADPRLTDRIVVLGGFQGGTDRHDTPWGTKYGAELVAMAVEEKLQPEALEHLAVPLKWLLKALIALAIAALHHYFRPLAATVMTGLFLPLAVLFSGWAMFRLGDYEITVVPFVVGILLEQLATSAEKAEHWSEQAAHWKKMAGGSP